MLWNAAYETGIPAIDAQHKELFNQVEILADTSKADRIGDTLNFLEGYVVRHFTTEENLQRQIAYPKIREHGNVHAEFVNTFRQLKEEYRLSGDDPVIAMKMTRIALDWLKEHVRGMDKEFAHMYLAARK